RASRLLLFLHHSPTPELYTLSLHDALPICPCLLQLVAEREVAKIVRRRSTWLAPCRVRLRRRNLDRFPGGFGLDGYHTWIGDDRSDEHTSELQSLTNLVCRLLLEKKKYHSV